jgi:hypothetical protein
MKAKQLTTAKKQPQHIKGRMHRRMRPVFLKNFMGKQSS